MFWKDRNVTFTSPTFVALRLVTAQTPRTVDEKPLISRELAERRKKLLKILNRTLTHPEPPQCPREARIPPNSSPLPPSSLSGGARDNRHPETQIFTISSSTSMERSLTHVNSYFFRGAQQMITICRSTKFPTRHKMAPVVQRPSKVPHMHCTHGLVFVVLGLLSDNA